MPKGKLKFAVVGYGHIGRRHAAMVAGNELAQVAAVVDPVEERRKLAQEDHGCQVFASSDELYASGMEIDVVNVCTPNGVHSDQAIEALSNRCHVVIEKPMGLTKHKTEEVIYKALQVSRQVFLVKQNRYSPSSAWLKSLMDENRFGEIFMVQLNCYWNRDDRYYKPGGWKGTKEMDGGTLFTQFSHFIDIMYWLFGDIENISGRSINNNHPSTEFEDTGIVNFDFVNGGMGSLNFSTSVWGQNLESSIIIIGEKGSVKVSGQYMDKVEYCHVEDYVMPELPPANPPNDYGTYKGSAANHHYVIQNVVDVLTGKAEISTNALEGMKVVEMIERIYKKIGQG
ncbi:Gfo/Idh/MocA family oxidoreductase [bacterium SCSIO 12741]|nr:Gfo/Idh/MocA family oxidoreductase [bacterium SCSIO 12741]